jgi:hypothetical protein
MNEKRNWNKCGKKASIKEQLISFSENVLGDKVGEFLRITSLIPGSRLSGMIVLPGSAYIEMALCGL